MRTTIARIDFETRVIEREIARRTRPKQNQVFIDNLPHTTLRQIRRELAADINKKTIARHFNVPHNIVMYIWEHDL